MPLELHLDPTGQDNHAGTADQPLATLFSARDRLRDLRRKGELPRDGATVTLHSGTYTLDATFALNAEDGGTAESPIVYRAAPGEVVDLTGGVAIAPDALLPVTDCDVLERLPEEAREAVRVVDLAALGLASPARPNAAEVTYRGVPMHPARWPNGGYATVAAAPAVTDEAGQPRAATPADGFHYSGDRPRRWQSHDDLWLHAWGNEWSTTRTRIAALDVERRLITTEEPHVQYGFEPRGRYFVFNVLEELDEPGEYYLDRTTGKLYLWLWQEAAEAFGGLPLEGLTLSRLETPLVSLQDAAHLRFEGLVLHHGRSDAIAIEGGSDVEVRRCTLVHCGRSAVRIEGGKRHRVRGCEIACLGQMGVSLNGGDRRTLERAEHAVENNHIHHYARWSYCYNGGVDVSGGSYGSLMGSVGIRIAHNRIHDCPHNGILYWGNDMVIEKNDIYRVVLESTDAGAIYTGRDFARRGSVIRHNHLHHNGTGGPFGTMGIYLDDCAGGERIEGNLLEGHRQAIYMGGGTHTECVGNLLVDCDPALHLDMRGTLGGCAGILKERFYEVEAQRPPYSERYPELAEIHACYERGEGVPPLGTRVERNLAAGRGAFWSYTAAGVERQYLNEEENLSGLPGAAVDRARGRLVAAHAEKEAEIGFAPIPVETIGLVADESRDAVPPRRLLDYQLRTETAWIWRDGNCTAPVFRLCVVNAGEVRETGEAEIFVSPAEDGALTGPTRLAFDLAPGASVISEPLSFSPDPGRTSLAMGVRRLAMPDLPVWHHLALQHEVTLPCLETVAGADEVADALAGVAPLCTAAWDGSEGAMRLARTEDALLLLADIDEAELRVEGGEDWWQGSCLEFFAAGPACATIEHLGLVPSDGAAPPQVLWFHEGQAAAQAPGAEVVSTPRTGGYRLAARIPEALLGWQGLSGAPQLEISICARPDLTAPRRRTRVFGVEVWMNERDRFARIL